VSELPKYYVYKMRILEMIADLPPGTLIPTERTLALDFGTSRTTVRKAIGELVAEGKLTRTQGSGTYTGGPKITHVRQLTSFTEDAQAIGYVPSSEILDIEQLHVDASHAVEAGHMQLGPGEPFVRVQRVRLGNGEPLGLETACIPGELKGFDERLRERGSLYATLREDFGIRITEVEDGVETYLAGPEEARLLKVEMGSPLLRIDRTGYDDDGRVVEWTVGRFCGDRFRFVARTRAAVA